MPLNVVFFVRLHKTRWDGRVTGSSEQVESVWQLLVFMKPEEFVWKNRPFVNVTRNQWELAEPGPAPHWLRVRLPV